MTLTLEQIYDNMCSIFESKSGRKVKENSDMAVRLYAMASQIAGLYLHYEWIRKQCFPQTATGENLDRHAEMRSISRIEATTATGEIQFSVATAANQDITIPEGTVCCTEEGICFQTTADGTLAAGETEVSVAATATEAGVIGNVASGTICHMTVPPVGIAACTNLAAFTGGAEQEDDETLRQRVLKTYANLSNGANAAFYEREVLNIPGVAATKILPQERGAGTVDIVISTAAGMPSQSLLDTVQSRINEVREICVDVLVCAPTQVSVNITVKIEPDTGYNFPALNGLVRSAITDYFNGMRLGENIRLSEIGRLLYQIPGIRNYRIVSPSEDVEIELDELPVLNTLTVDEWS